MSVAIPHEQLVECVEHIRGKTVVITGLYGSTHGVGKEAVLLCAQNGANIVLADRDPASLAAIAKMIDAVEGCAVYKTIDVRRLEEVEELYEFAASTFGNVDIVINIAGLGGEEFIELTEREKDHLYDPMILGVRYATRIGLQYLERNKKSSPKSLVLITTPGINNIKLNGAAATIKAFLPQCENKGIKLGAVFPFFGNGPKGLPPTIPKMAVRMRPALDKVALAALFVATNPANNGCHVFVVGPGPVRMFSDGSFEKLKTKFSSLQAPSILDQSESQNIKAPPPWLNYFTPPTSPEPPEASGSEARFSSPLESEQREPVEDLKTPDLSKLSTQPIRITSKL